MKAEMDIRQSSEIKCIDCLRDIICNGDIPEEPAHAKPMRYVINGDSVCGEHARERLRVTRNPRFDVYRHSIENHHKSRHCKEP